MVAFEKPMKIFKSLLVPILFVVCACSGPQPPASAPASSAQLWGDMKPTVSVKELMRDMIDPASDFVFNSVGAIITNRTVVETEPRTDEDWARIRFGAVSLAEGAYLLKVKRPFTPPGDNNDSDGPEAPELSPAQILAKIEKDPVLWEAKIEALRNVGLEVLDIVKRKDKNELWEAAENLDQACETCHLEYWYPGQVALMSKLDRRLLEMYGPRASGNSAPIGMPAPKPER
jgi:hypothetical protein